jgi:hypothetical protein
MELLANRGRLSDNRVSSEEEWERMMGLGGEMEINWGPIVFCGVSVLLFGIAVVVVIVLLTKKAP